MLQVFAELAKGNPALVDIIGSILLDHHGHTRCSKSYRGKHAVQIWLSKPLFAQFTSAYTNTARDHIGQVGCVPLRARDVC
jgi:hypothetical protein